MEYFKLADAAVFLAGQAEFRVMRIQLDWDPFLRTQEYLSHLSVGKGQALQEPLFKLELPDIGPWHGPIEQPLLIIGLVLVYVVDVIVYGLVHHRRDFFVAVSDCRYIQFDAESFPHIGIGTGSLDVTSQLPGLIIHGCSLGDAHGIALVSLCRYDA
ncbi:MAG: hypothetical protein OXE87_13730 [Chloroflexi bacterium]|nr:hypothetical protein [Chloroflexota bacterium]